MVGLSKTQNKKYVICEIGFVSLKRTGTLTGTMIADGVANVGGPGAGELGAWLAMAWIVSKIQSMWI